VAADERGVNATVRRLLTGHFARSARIYAVVGVTSYLLNSAFWSLRFGRIPLAGALLAVWGSLAAFNTRSLVWRSLPINISDVALYRWWAAVGVPGVFLMLVTLLSWCVQVSSRLPVPAAPQVLLDVLANWAALGLLAALWDEIRYPSTSSQALTAAKMAALTALAAMFTIYGLPIESDSLGFSCIFVGAGLVLPVLGALRARRASDKRWVYAAGRKLHLKFWNTAPESASGLYGVKSFYLPVMRYTVILTTAAMVGLVAAHKVFSSKGHAKTDMLLLLAAFVGLSISGSVLTHRLRTAMQPLRCLPLSANRLAGLLQIIGALPGMIAAMLTLLAARFLLQLNIDMWTSAGFALTLFSSLGMMGFTQRWQERPPYRGVFVQRWLPVIQGSLVPGYFGLVFVQIIESGYWSSPVRAATHWIWLPLGIFCFGIGHVALVRYLRGGIRPSAEQNAFSAG
jgi:hypothetical protein